MSKPHAAPSALMTGLAVSLFVGLVAAVAYILHLHQQQSDLEDKLLLMQWELKKMEETIPPLEARIAILEKTSLQAVAKDAGDVLQAGWNTLLNAVGDELERAQSGWEELQDELKALDLDEPDPSETPSNQQDPRA